MDDHKKDLEKAPAPQIDVREASVQILDDNAPLVTEARSAAFAPGSAIVNSGFIPTFQTIANLVKTYGKTTIAMIGPPDQTGTEAERRALAKQRAEAIRTMLLGMRGSPVLVTASGYPNSQYMDGRAEVVIHPLTST